MTEASRVVLNDGNYNFCRPNVNWLRSQVSDETREVPFQHVFADFDAVHHNEFHLFNNPPKYVRVTLKYLQSPFDLVPHLGWWVRDKWRNQGRYARPRDGTLTPATAPE